MNVSTPYDVFEVLIHVDDQISKDFIPAWVRMKLADFVGRGICKTVSSPSIKELAKSVEALIVATRGSEFRKCRLGDTDTFKRIVSQVQRNAMTAPKKIKKINTKSHLTF